MAVHKPSREERALWRAAMRDVAPLRSASPRLAEKPASAPPPASAPAEATKPMRAPPLGAGLDRRSALRLKRGQMPIEARLDLHGMTQAEAHAALRCFVLRAQEQGRRAVLIITGKGTAEGGGVLRRAVPLWLEEPALARRILATAQAQPQHGGAGALYLLLRRTR